MTKRRILAGLIGRNIRARWFAGAFAMRSRPPASTAITSHGFVACPGAAAQLLDAIKVTGFAGANVTYPFKQEIIPLLDAVDPEAAQVDAATPSQVAPDGRTTGYNFRSPRLAQRLRGEPRRR